MLITACKNSAGLNRHLTSPRTKTRGETEQLDLLTLVKLKNITFIDEVGVNFDKATKGFNLWTRVHYDSEHSSNERLHCPVCTPGLNIPEVNTKLFKLRDAVLNVDYETSNQFRTAISNYTKERILVIDDYYLQEIKRRCGYDIMAFLNLDVDFHPGVIWKNDQPILEIVSKEYRSSMFDIRILFKIVHGKSTPIVLVIAKGFFTLKNMKYICISSNNYKNIYYVTNDEYKNDITF